MYNLSLLVILIKRFNVHICIRLNHDSRNQIALFEPVTDDFTFRALEDLKREAYYKTLMSRFPDPRISATDVAMRGAKQ
jgi:hypothetical protein